MAVRKEKSSLLMLLPAGSYQESLNLFLAVWIYAARQGLLQLSALPGYWPLFANGALQGGGGLPCVPSPLTALLGVGFIPFLGSSETKQLVTPPATVGWAPLQAQPGWGTEPRSVQEPSSHLFVFIYSFFCIHQCRYVFAQDVPQQGGDLAATMSIEWC